MSGIVGDARVLIDHARVESQRLWRAHNIESAEKQEKALKFRRDRVKRMQRSGKYTAAEVKAAMEKNLAEVYAEIDAKKRKQSPTGFHPNKPPKRKPPLRG